jgi:hypothetical protein
MIEQEICLISSHDMLVWAHTLILYSIWPSQSDNPADICSSRIMTPLNKLYLLDQCTRMSRTSQRVSLDALLAKRLSGLSYSSRDHYPSTKAVPEILPITSCRVAARPAFYPRHCPGISIGPSFLA